MDGVLLVDKPAGWTSHDVVARVRGLLRQAQSPGNRLLANSSQLSARVPKVRVGHTGTLDPAASGLVILVLGKYTKRASEFSKLDKTYEVEMTLGAISSTGDIEGDIAQKSTQQPSLAEVKAALSKFVGQISQTPPIYSAIKVNGQRAYKLARAGKQVKLEPRQVTIHSIDGVQYNYPRLTFKTEVSSGTYVRSLSEDIGTELGTGAYMSALRRVQVGGYALTEAISLDKLTYNVIIEHVKQIS